MRATILLHLDKNDEQVPVWWAESDELPGATAVADSLSQLRQNILEMIQWFNEENGESDITYGSEVLVVASDPAVLLKDVEMPSGGEPARVQVSGPDVTWARIVTAV